MAWGRATGTGFGAQEAKALLERLVKNGVVKSADITNARRDIETEKSELVARLEALGGVSALAGVAVGAAVAAAAPAVRRGARRLVARVRQVSPEQAASRILQGRYLGLMRQIPKNVVKQRFGRDAIAEKGKEKVVAEMDAYVREQSSGAGANAPRKSRKVR